MFVGVLDTAPFRLEYGSAGHDCAFLRRGGSVEQLAVTGPVLGVMEEPFYSKTIDLAAGDMLVLTTDGLTEVRNSEGKQLLEGGAMELIARADPHAQQLADELVAAVRARGGGRLRDDLAILAIRLLDGGRLVSRFAAALLLAWLAAIQPALADCKVHPGDNVVLYSTTRRSVGADLGLARTLARIQCRLVRRGAGNAAARGIGCAGHARERDHVYSQLH